MLIFISLGKGIVKLFVYGYSPLWKIIYGHKYFSKIKMASAINKIMEREKVFKIKPVQNLFQLHTRAPT